MTGTSVTHSSATSDRQRLLITTNLRWLRKGIDLLSNISDRAYTETPVGFEPHRVGGHMRHILEFYECFLDGLQTGRINYDARKRNLLIQQSRDYAIGTIRIVIDRLQQIQNSAVRHLLWVRMEDVSDTDIQDPFLASSTERELQVLSSHTIHHFALVAMTLRAQGIHVDTDFGMAPSTLRHLASQGSAEGAVACAQ